MRKIDPESPIPGSIPITGQLAPEGSYFTTPALEGYSTVDYDAASIGGINKPKWWQAKWNIALKIPYASQNIKRDNLANFPAMRPQFYQNNGSYPAEAEQGDTTLANDLFDGPPLQPSMEAWWNASFNLAFAAPYTMRPDRATLFGPHRANSLSPVLPLPEILFRGVRIDPPSMPVQGAPVLMGWARRRSYVEDEVGPPLRIEPWRRPETQGRP